MEQIIAQILLDGANEIIKAIDNCGVSNFEMILRSVKEPTFNCVLKLLAAVLDQIDKALLENKSQRKNDRLTVHKKKVPRTLVTPLGELVYNRTQFKYETEDGDRQYICLTDCIIGVERYERISAELVAEILSDVESLSYRKAAKSNAGNISAQTVHNRLIAAKEFAQEVSRLPVPEKGLDIFADEDHVHMQPKKSAMVPLVVITEGIRNGKTVQPFYMQGFGMDHDAFFENVLSVMEKRYEFTDTTPVRIHADGGSWMKGLKELSPNTTVYMDGFHVEKYLKKLQHFKEGSRYISRLRKALHECDMDEFFVLGTELASLQDEKEAEKVHEVLAYFENNRESIENRMRAKENGVCGSCTEGLVSHTLSERLSRNPISWSSKGLAKTTSLLIFKKNGGEITPDLIRCSVPKKVEKEEHDSFRENGVKKYSDYAEEQSKIFLQKKYDWSIFESSQSTFGKIDGTRVILSALGKIRNPLHA